LTTTKRRGAYGTHERADNEAPNQQGKVKKKGSSEVRKKRKIRGSKPLFFFARKKKTYTARKRNLGQAKRKQLVARQKVSRKKSAQREKNVDG